MIARNENKSKEAIALAVLRIAAGLMLLPHGLALVVAVSTEGGRQAIGPLFASLGLTPGIYWSVAAAVADTLIGLLIAIGLFTRIAAAAGVILMGTIAAIMSSNGWVWLENGAEFPFLWGLIFALICFAGGGVWSVDSWWQRKVK